MFESFLEVLDALLTLTLDYYLYMFSLSSSAFSVTVFGRLLKTGHTGVWQVISSVGGASSQLTDLLQLFELLICDSCDSLADRCFICFIPAEKMQRDSRLVST